MRVARQTRKLYTKPCLDMVQVMSKEPRLKDKVCVITGASRGFGQGIAVRFVEEGARVALLSGEGHDETFAAIRSIRGFEGSVGDVALGATGDISKEEDCENFMRMVQQRWGCADVLVNNACKFVFSSVEAAEPSMWDDTCNVNIKGHALMTKHAIPHFKENGGGAIVFQGSISSYLAQPNCTTYSTVKAAIVQMARSCAYDLAKYNVRVNSVCAGTIETPISQVERDTHGWSYEEWEELKTRDVMLQRVGTVREIANAALFFACHESSYCTGTHLFVDGGQTACTVMA